MTPRRQRARRVARVGAGDRLQLGRSVGDGAGHRTGGVLRGGDRHDPEAAHEADGRPQADYSLRRRRADDRARGLGADRGGGQRGRGGGRRAGGRAARVLVGVERVQHLPAEAGVAARIAVGDEVGELAEVGLAEDHGARRAQTRDHRRVLGRDRALERDGAGRGRQARDVEVVLHQHRDAVQRPARSGLGALEVEQRGVGQRVRVDEPHGVQPGPTAVERGDALEVGLGQLDAGELTGGHPGLQVGDGEALEVERRGGRGRGRQQEPHERDDHGTHGHEISSARVRAPVENSPRLERMSRVTATTAAGWGGWGIGGCGLPHAGPVHCRF